jgi:hypothetical protein
MFYTGGNSLFDWHILAGITPFRLVWAGVHVRVMYRLSVEVCFWPTAYCLRWRLEDDGDIFLLQWSTDFDKNTWNCISENNIARSTAVSIWVRLPT